MNISGVGLEGDTYRSAKRSSSRSSGSVIAVVSEGMRVSNDEVQQRWSLVGLCVFQVSSQISFAVRTIVCVSSSSLDWNHSGVKIERFLKTPETLMIER